MSRKRRLADDWECQFCHSVWPAQQKKCTRRTFKREAEPVIPLTELERATYVPKIKEEGTLLLGF